MWILKLGGNLIYVEIGTSAKKVTGSCSQKYLWRLEGTKPEAEVGPRLNGMAQATR